MRAGLRALLAVVTLFGTVLTWAPPAVAADDPAVRLVSQTPWVRPGGELLLRFGLTGVDDPADYDVVVSVHAKIPDRSTFTFTLRNELLGRSLKRIGPAKVADIGEDPAGGRLVRIPVLDPANPEPQPDAVRLTREGVYPVSLELRETAGGPVVDRFTTHLLLLPATPGDAAPLAVAWVQPIIAAPAVQPDGSVQLPERAHDRLATLASALEQNPDVPLSVAPSPETIDALALLDGDAASDTLTDLRAGVAGRQLIAGPYVDIPVSALLDAGLDGEVAAQLTEGAATLARALGVRGDFRTWVGDRSLDPDSAARLRDLGVDQLVVPEANLEPIDRALTLTQPFEIDAVSTRQRAVMADAGLASHFERKRQGDDVLRAHQLLADLAVLYFDSPGVTRGVVVSVPADWRPSRGFLDAALTGLAADSVLDAVTVDDLFAGVPPAEEDGEPLVRAIVGGRPGRLGIASSEIARLRTRLQGFESMAQRPVPLVASVARRLLVSEATGLSTARRREYLAAGGTELDAELSKIQAPDRTSIRLTARSGTIPLTFRNDADYPVEVDVRLDSDKMEFPEGTCPGASPDACWTRRLVLDRDNTKVEVDVRARTSGNFPLRVDVRSPDGGVEVRQTRITVRSTAASGVGIVLTVSAGLFLVVWWGRNWRSARRDRRLVHV